MLPSPAMEKFSPVLLSIIGSIARALLTPIVVWLNANHVIDWSPTAEFYSEVAAAAVTLGWIVRTKIVERRRLNTAVAMGTPGTVSEVNELMREGTFAPALTPANRVPVITGTGDGGPPRY